MASNLHASALTAADAVVLPLVQRSQDLMSTREATRYDIGTFKKKNHATHYCMVAKIRE
jgi:hypothetical protein